MYKGACEFLKIFEDVNPLQGAHIGYFNAWADSARHLWNIQFSDDDSAFEDILDYRKKSFQAQQIIRDAAPSPLGGVFPTPRESQDDSWKWLLTVKQIEQRSEEWYSETKNLITASEIAAIWKGPRTRASLVLSKVPQVKPVIREEDADDMPIAQKNTAVRREKTGPMDWGVRYEPVVKQILEESLGAKIQDLGRIRHRTADRVAASPDGLFTECSKQPELVGTLVEIKCPPSRVINDKIPFEYWCQMQLQMEVCERPSCEFVEAKFKELSEGESPTEGSTHGWIVLEGNSDTMEMRYVYSSVEPFEQPQEQPQEQPLLPQQLQQEQQQDSNPWVFMEKYQWELRQLRRVTVPKDLEWFKNSQVDLAAFWADVDAARKGEWTPPSPRPPSKKKLAAEAAAATGSRCAIVDSSDGGCVMSDEIR
jgi:putative phage-type endonuclease